jgi:sugar phosphate isomerase/epimerase
LRQGLSLDEIIDSAGGAGFEGIEIRLAAAADYASQHGLPALRGRLATAGLGVAGFGYPVALRSPSDEFERGLADLPAACTLAASLGARGGTAVLPYRQGDGYSVTRAETVDRVGRLAEVAASYTLAIYLEFIGLRHFPDGLDWARTLGQTLDLADEVGAPNIGVLIDSYHWHLGGSQTVDLTRVRPGQPILVHINDAPPGDVATLTDAMRVLPGEGVIDLPAWLAAIRAATGYDDYVSLELFNEELRALDPRQAARRAKQALDGVLARLPT